MDGDEGYEWNLVIDLISIIWILLILNINVNVNIIKEKYITFFNIKSILLNTIIKLVIT